MQTAATIVALILGVANLVWLAIQWNRGRKTLEIAQEAHAWARERRDSQRAADEREAARSAWWQEMRKRIDLSDGPVLVPDDVDPTWVIEGEQRGYFKRIRDPHGDLRVWVPDL